MESSLDSPALLEGYVFYKTIGEIGVKGYAFKNYGSLELSFAEFSGLAVGTQLR